MRDQRRTCPRWAEISIKNNSLVQKVNPTSTAHVTSSWEQMAGGSRNRGTNRQPKAQDGSQKYISKNPTRLNWCKQNIQIELGCVPPDFPWLHHNLVILREQWPLDYIQRTMTRVVAYTPIKVWRSWKCWLWAKTNTAIVKRWRAKAGYRGGKTVTESWGGGCFVIRTVHEEAGWSRASSPASTGLHTEARFNIKYPQEPGIRIVFLAQVDKWTSLFQL